MIVIIIVLIYLIRQGCPTGVSKDMMSLCMLFGVVIGKSQGLVVCSVKGSGKSPL